MSARENLEKELFPNVETPIFKKGKRATMADAKLVVEKIEDKLVSISAEATDEIAQMCAEAYIEWFLQLEIPTPSALRSAKRSALLSLELEGFVRPEMTHSPIFAATKNYLVTFDPSQNLFSHEK